MGTPRVDDLFASPSLLTACELWALSHPRLCDVNLEFLMRAFSLVEWTMFRLSCVLCTGKGAGGRWWGSEICTAVWPSRHTTYLLSSAYMSHETSLIGWIIPPFQPWPTSNIGIKVCLFVRLFLRTYYIFFLNRYCFQHISTVITS